MLPSSGTELLVTPDGVHCRGPITLEDSMLQPTRLQQISHQLESCGFVYLAPGAIDQGWITVANEHVQTMWLSFTDLESKARHAAGVPAGGRSRDRVT